MRVFGFEITRKKHPTRFLGELIKVDLSPGDVCVLMTQSRLSREAIESISASWRAAVGDDVTLIVLEDGMRLGVLSPPQAVAVHERLTDEKAVELSIERAAS